MTTQYLSGRSSDILLDCDSISWDPDNELCACMCMCACVCGVRLCAHSWGECCNCSSVSGWPDECSINSPVVVAGSITRDKSLSSLSSSNMPLKVGVKRVGVALIDMKASCVGVAFS